MFSVDRPSTNASLGSRSATRAMAAPVDIERTSQVSASRAKRAGTGNPGIAWASSTRQTALATRVSARRGRITSLTLSRNVEDSSAMNGPPNMLSPVRTAEPVSANVIVPRARPAVAPATMFRHCVTNRTRNSATAKRER